MENTTQQTADREIVISRVLNAPRELVFDVWTDPAHVAAWWGPNGFTTTIHDMDVREGGVWNFIMHGPDGTDFPNRIVYKEVIRPERLVYHHGSADENDPVSFDVTITFEEQGGKTLLTMKSVFKSAAVREMVVKEFGAIEGGEQTLNRFEEYLASGRFRS